MTAGEDSDSSAADEFAGWWRETGEHELRQVLLWRWDPLGVADHFPNTADEYDGYAPQVVQALRKGASETELMRLLGDFERDSMGLSAPALARLRPLAVSLLFWFQNSQDSWRKFGAVRR
jgi:hypothetical protein